jgi:deoxyhypusine synthase
VATRRGRLDKQPRIDPRPIDSAISVSELVDQTFLAYNAARLREACQLFVRRMLAADVTVGVRWSAPVRICITTRTSASD